MKNFSFARPVSKIHAWIYEALSDIVDFRLLTLMEHEKCVAKQDREKGTPTDRRDAVKTNSDER